MARGKVKWFDPQKGFGFVVNEDGADVFVHYTSIEGDGFRCLKNGQMVEYRLKKTDKGLQGLQVKAVADTTEKVGSNDERERKSSHISTR